MEGAEKGGDELTPRDTIGPGNERGLRLGDARIGRESMVDPFTLDDLLAWGHTGSSCRCASHVSSKGVQLNGESIKSLASFSNSDKNAYKWTSRADLSGARGELKAASIAPLIKYLILDVNESTASHPISQVLGDRRYNMAQRSLLNNMYSPLILQNRSACKFYKPSALDRCLSQDGFGT